MKTDKKKYLYSVVEMLIVVVVTVCVFKYIVIPVRIDGSSMENGLHHNNVALINAIGVSEDNIKRFDVVVAYCEALNEKIIKRVIGMPGDTVEFKDDTLYINGTMTSQDFLDNDFVSSSKVTYNAEKFTDDFKVVVSDNEYFLMGDNRLRSADSREFGGFTIDKILGIQGLVIYPLSDIQWLD
ncbi:MAG: signal peptidase I [Coprobacillus sp.]